MGGPPPVTGAVTECPASRSGSVAIPAVAAGGTANRILEREEACPIIYNMERAYVLRQ